MKKTFNLFLVYIWLTGLYVSAQVSGLQFKRFSIREGLASPMVFTIVKDNQGFLWFGTLNGLNRYDGYQFRAFINDPMDSTSISDNWIKCLFVSRNGNLWIGTHNGGLNCYNPKSEEFTSFKKNKRGPLDLSFNDITTLYEDDEGTLWIGTNGDGLYWKEAAGKTFNHVINNPLIASSVNDNAIRCVLADSRGNIWVGTTKGLCLSRRGEKHSGEFIQINPDLNKSSESGKYTDVSSIYETNYGDILIGTGDGALYKYDEKSKNIEMLFNLGGKSQGTRDNWITCIHEDRFKRLWIGTLNNGLKIFDLEGKLLYDLRYKSTDPASLVSNNVISICEDDAGGIWIGTRDGVSYYDHRQKQFINILHQADNPYSLSKGSVQAICGDTNGDLWIGTHGGGLNYLPYGSSVFKHYVHDVRNPFSISSDFIICMSCKDTNFIWLGTRGGGLNKFDKLNKIFTRFLHNSNDSTSLSDNIINCLDLDSRKNVWIGTSYNGVDKLDKATRKFIHYQNNPADSTSFGGKISWSLLADSRDNVWVGTPGDGLNRLDRRTDRFTHLLNKQGDPRTLSNNYVSSIYEYPEDIIWVGTVGGGLNRYDEAAKSFACYTTREGFADNQVAAITHDSQGRLWLAAKYLTRLDPKIGSVKIFDGRDGIKCGELNQGAAHAGNKGRVYFGGTDGYVYFHPDSIRDNDYRPPIVLTSFKIFEKYRKLPADSAAGIVLSHEENYFSFEFAALSYTAPEKNMYRYKLDGFDEDWISSGTRRHASYTQVEPGDYVFRVQGSNNDGVWNTEGASIAVSIIPPFWKTLWFRLIALIAIVSIVTFAVHQRFKFLHQRAKQQQELSRKLLESQEEERKRIGAGLHDSLGQDLLVIKNLAVMGIEANENKDSSDERLKQISTLVSQMLAEVREISYNLRPYHLDQLGLTGALKSIISRVTSSSSIVFEEDLDDLNNLFPKELEINIFRIVQEAVNNIIKHSRATKTLIRIKREKDRAKFYISDNGIGFDVSRQGFGLTGMAERVRILNGSMEIISEPGAGTAIKVNIPLRGKND